MKSIVAASLVLLATSTILFCVTYYLYKRAFFLYVGLAWLGNALYLLLEGFELLDANAQQQLLAPYFASLPSSYLLFLAWLDLRQGVRQSRRLLIAITLFILAGVLLFYLIAYHGLPPERTDRFEICIIPGVFFNAIVLFMLARTLAKLRSKAFLSLLRTDPYPVPPLSDQGDPDKTPKTQGTHVILPKRTVKALRYSKRLLVTSFSLYGVLQFFYFMREDHGDLMWFKMLFSVGFALKTLNTVALLPLLLADFRIVSEALQRKGVLEEMAALTASVEHDIRNPVSSMLKKLALMRTKFQSNSRLVTDVKFLKRELLRINAAADVIPVLREGSAYYEAHSSSWNLVEIVRTASRLSASAYEHVAPRVDPDFSRSVILVKVYRERIIQALINVFNNSIEACLAKSPKTTPTVSVRIRSVTINKSHKAHILIRDEGTGIKESILPFVTRPMFTTKSMKNSPNRGLGLFVAHRIVEQHRGQLLVTSDGHSYTEVSIYIPLLEE